MRTLSQQWTFGFPERWGISCLAKWILASHRGLCSKELAVCSVGSLCMMNELYIMYYCTISAVATSDSIIPKVSVKIASYSGYVHLLSWGCLHARLYHHRALILAVFSMCLSNVFVPPHVHVPGKLALILQLNWRKEGRNSSCWYYNLLSPYIRLYSEGYLGPLPK